MRTIERITLSLLATTGLSAGISQMPEVFDCTHQDGTNATEWIGGDVEVPHCDEANMSDIGNSIHDIGKLSTIGLGAGAAICTALVLVGERRQGRSAVESSGN